MARLFNTRRWPGLILCRNFRSGASTVQKLCLVDDKHIAVEPDSKLTFALLETNHAGGMELSASPWYSGVSGSACGGMYEGDSLSGGAQDKWSGPGIEIGD